MQLSPRPTRIPLTCSCGARLSVIPRLQGMEVKCPRCRESLLVPGEAGIQVLDDEPNVPAERMTLEVPVLGGLGSGVLENSISNAELAEAASESVQEPIRGIGESSFRQVPITSRDRDMFGYLLTDAAASVNCMLEERTPKTIRTLKMESQYSATQRHIEQLLNEGKVRAVRMDTSEVGYIINPDWLTQLRKVPPVDAAINAPTISMSEEFPKKIGDIRPSADQPGANERDIFGRTPGFGAALMNTFLSETIPKTARTLMDLSGYQNTTNHLRQLRLEGKVRQVPMSGGQTGWIIDSEWLKSISSSVSRSNPTENEPTRSQSPGTFDPPVRGDVKVDSEKLSGTSKKKFQPIGFTAPTRLKKRQQTANLFSPNGTGLEPELEANCNESNSASVPTYDLTASQNKIFATVESSYASAGISPTIPELQTATSLNRFDTIKEVDALVRKGLFEFDRSSARGIRIIPEAERVLFTDRSDSIIESDAVSESAQPRSVSPADEIVAATEPALSSAKTLEHVADAVAFKLSSLGSPVTPVDSTPVLPGWITELLKSELLDRQFQMAGRRVPPRETLKDFLLLLASQGFVIHRESLCHALELPVIRYAGFLSVVMRLLNIDNVPILSRDDDGEMVRLNVDLLCRQFCIVKL